jgi:WhiB family redox-sensing transcriptional regulator
MMLPGHHKNPTGNHRLDGEDCEWVLRGVCRNHENPDVWHPAKPGDAWLGVALCHTCPVMRQCLAWAVAHDEHAGTWGGLDEWDRAKMFGTPCQRRRAKRAL